MTLGMANTRHDAGVSVVELNLSQVSDIVQQTKVGNRGVAYVVDAGGASSRIQIPACVSPCGICHPSPRCRRRAAQQL
jgi:hypothetical protein